MKIILLGLLVAACGSVEQDHSNLSSGRPVNMNAGYRFEVKGEGNLTYLEKFKELVEAEAGRDLPGKIEVYKVSRSLVHKGKKFIFTVHNMKEAAKIRSKKGFNGDKSAAIQSLERKRHSRC